MQDIRQSNQWQTYMQSLGWKTVRVDTIVGYKKTLPLLGSIIKFQRCPIPKNLPEIIQIGKRERAFLIKIEPTKPFAPSIFQSNTSSTMPTKTIWIDLLKPTHSLWHEVRASTKTKINNAKRAGINIKQSTHIDQFTQFWKQSSRRRSMWAGQTSQLQKLWHAFPPQKKIILFAQKEDRILAGIFLLFHDHTAYYMYAFSTNEGRQSNAAHLLAWEAIVESKRLHMKRFDFEGIYEKGSAPKSWQGFTFFKTGFGGKEITFPHAYTKTLGWASLPLVKYLF